jgi:hypothetical protein
MFLDPKLNRGAWTEEEDRLVLEYADAMGCKWPRLAGLLPHRSTIHIRNRWTKLMRSRRSPAFAADPSLDPLPKTEGVGASQILEHICYDLEAIEAQIIKPKKSGEIHPRPRRSQILSAAEMFHTSPVFFSDITIDEPYAESGLDDWCQEFMVFAGECGLV